MLASVAGNVEGAPDVRGHRRRVGVELAAARGAEAEEQQRWRATTLHDRDARAMAGRRHDGYALA